MRAPVTALVPNAFLLGVPFDSPEPLRVGVRQAGEALDFTFADFGIPLIRKELADAIGEIASGDVQLIPVYVEGRPEEYRLLNVTAIADCLDAKASQVAYWTEADGVQELVGACCRSSIR